MRRKEEAQVVGTPLALFCIGTAAALDRLERPQAVTPMSPSTGTERRCLKTNKENRDDPQGKSSLEGHWSRRHRPSLERIRRAH
jgi:hypothetical protein